MISLIKTILVAIFGRWLQHKSDVAKDAGRAEAKLEDAKDAIAGYERMEKARAEHGSDSSESAAGKGQF